MLETDEYRYPCAIVEDPTTPKSAIIYKNTSEESLEIGILENEEKRKIGVLYKQLYIQRDDNSFYFYDQSMHQEIVDAKSLELKEGEEFCISSFGLNELSASVLSFCKGQTTATINNI